MKINRLETHDRLLEFKKDQSNTISQGVEDCLKKNPDSLSLQQKSPYIYIFAHPRTADDGVTKRMLWQPRLTRPQPQDNSYLFRAKSNSDLLEICWLLPPKELWDQYKKGNVTENNDILWSINQYRDNVKGLAKPHPEDMNEERAKQIYHAFLNEKAQDIKRKKCLEAGLILMDEPYERI